MTQNVSQAQIIDNYRQTADKVVAANVVNETVNKSSNTQSTTNHK